MPPLPSDLRNKLERAITDARDVAEVGARAALEALAVHEPKAYKHMDDAQKRLRNQLRARARQLADVQNAKDELTIEHLVHECAYEQWHRMLFARFLAENNLLIEPTSKLAISLAECEELAKEAKVDLWTYASRCAQQMLPQIFRPDDPVLQIDLANEHRVKLERLLAGLATDTFTADDALGWVYQFWQSKRKDQVNASGEKITGDTLPAVTQLFTEHYMVLFLLHNTLGAWHAGKVAAASSRWSACASEVDCRRLCALPGVDWEYLRFVQGADGKGGAWRPAAGTFEGWPKRAAEIKFLDPCCGSGHFLIAGFELLVRLRMQEEGLSLADAADAVIRDNLHGLELDPRCTQIAAFNVALAAWKLTGHRPLPAMHIACTGIGPSGTMEEWVSFATKSSWRLPPIARPFVEDGLKGMHQLFSQAPTLGSLINPHHVGGTLITADYETLRPHLAGALSAELGDDLAHERAVAAAGMAKAAEILAGEYILVVTNVPYLATRKQDEMLRSHLQANFYDARFDLATAMLSRIFDLLKHCGSTAVVIPQNWQFLSSYKAFRQRLLTEASWHLITRLGPGAFETISGAVVNVALFVASKARRPANYSFGGLEMPTGSSCIEKNGFTKSLPIEFVEQAEQLIHPDAVIFLTKHAQIERLDSRSIALAGILNGDTIRFRMNFWEVPEHGVHGWAFLLQNPPSTMHFGGRDSVIRWENGNGQLRSLAVSLKDRLHDADRRGNEAWGKRGIAVSRMGDICATLYDGELFDQNVAVILPNESDGLAPIWAFCESPEFGIAVRVINPNLAISSATVAKVPFDLVHWQAIAESQYPGGLPAPESSDPTQWLFHGRPELSTAPLLVAIGRLLGFRWPAELDVSMRLSQRARDIVSRCGDLLRFGDDDGIVCIPSVRGEERAADRLLVLLSACGISPDRDLDDWLRNDFFQEHCELFHHRPFVWHIWDGRKRDGFHALINYHKLAEGDGKGKKLLESLTYSYLGEWINRQQQDKKTGAEGAEGRLEAALELKKRLVAILEGEPPYDLFIRWKPLHQQPIGWEPDINDGVRLNIRPFLANDLPNGKKGAGILCWKPNIKWEKDRGREPQREKADYPWFWTWDGKTQDFPGGKDFDGNRWNDCHYTNATKRAAREGKR